MSDFTTRIKQVEEAAGAFLAARVAGRDEGLADSHDGSRYVAWDESVTTAVEVALATGRPLLATGDPGTGKSFLAHKLAHDLNRSCLTLTVTSRTQAQDVLWKVDHVRRLRDATIGRMRSASDGDGNDVGDSMVPYVEPGVLWWAVDPTSAASRGGHSAPDVDSSPSPPPGFDAQRHGAVILIDEIDKAEPDFPNSLLEPLGRMSFEVTDLKTRVKVSQDRWPVVVITSNAERELSRAFLRRCVHVTLRLPSNEQLRSIGRSHFGVPGAPLDEPGTPDLEAQMSQILDDIQPTDDPVGERRIVPATWVDLLRSLRIAGITPSSAEWSTVRGLLGVPQK